MASQRLRSASAVPAGLPAHCVGPGRRHDKVIPDAPLPSAAIDSEIADLIAVLNDTAERLEFLTNGQVDSVSDRDGRTFLLRHAQDHLRQSEATRQAAVLNALPANIALLDDQGVIVSVNEAWLRFARANVLQTPGYAIGTNYLEICTGAQGRDSADADRVAEGIRSVLSGSEGSFSIEYPCHSPSKQRWFLCLVTPLDDDNRYGAVVMHIDITEHKQVESQLQLAHIALQHSEASMSAAQRIAHFGSWQLELTDPVHVNANPLHWSDEMFRIAGYEPGTVDVTNEFFFAHVPAEEHASIQLAVAEAIRTHATYSIVHRMIRPGGEERIVHEVGQISYDEHTRQPLRIDGAAHDITERKHAEQALEALSREKEQKERVLHTMLASITDFAYIFDREGRFLFANQPLLDLWGIPLEAAVGKTFSEIGYTEELAAKMKGQIDEVIANRTRVTDETLYTNPEGLEGTYEYIFSPVVAADGTVEFVVGSTRDITQRKRTELEMSRINQDLLASEIRINYLNRVHVVLSGINALIVRVHDRDELFRGACRIAVEDGGFYFAFVAWLDPATSKIVPVAMAGDDVSLLAWIQRTLASDEDAPKTMVARVLRTKASFVSADAQNDPQILQSGQYAKSGIRGFAVFPLVVDGEAVGVFTLYADEPDFFHAEETALLGELSNDISFAIDYIGKADKLRYLTYYDELTGLPNRQLLLDRVTQRMASAATRAHHLAVMLFDIERFKSINDSLGRPAGDILLKQVADWLTQETGGATLLGRLGADHFAVVLPDAEPDGDVAHFLEKTMGALAQHPFRLNDASFRITFKAGVALFPDDGDHADTLLQHAEAALKKAKTSGDPYLFFSKAMSDKVAGKLTLENKLKLAIDNEEFVLHYQPKMHLASGKLTGAEALIRWNDPTSGLVAPYLFIPILEETGLIHAVGRWALRKAVADYLRWRKAGFPAVRIAVNVSPLQLRDHGFVDEIRQVIGVDTQALEGLELEITESMIMEDVKHAIAILHAIRALGIPVAIDDFGTGFSSLSYLSKLPIDTLKVDGSFVMDMTASSDGLALVSTIINLAHSLRLKVVAEGVETEEQRRLLQVLRCDEMQGFLFSKPVPSDVFEAKFLAPAVSAPPQ